MSEFTDKGLFSIPSLPGRAQQVLTNVEEKKERKFSECKRKGTWWLSGSHTRSGQVPHHQAGSAERGGSEEVALEAQKVYVLCTRKADTTSDINMVYIRVQALFVQSESYFAFLKMFTSFSTECLFSKQWNIQQLLLLNVTWIYTSDAAQTVF